MAYNRKTNNTIYPLVSAPNWQYGNANPNVIDATVSDTTGSAAGSAGLLSNFFNRFGKGKTLLSGINFPNLSGLGANIRGTRIMEGGPTIGNAAAGIMGAYQGINAAKGLMNNTNAESDLAKLKNDVNLAMASNPMYDMYLDASDEKLLRQLQNNTLSNNWAQAAEGALNGIPQAALTAVLGGVTGGPLGAILGGVGSLGNSAISGYGEGISNSEAKLQNLYTKLKQADEEYRSMRRPRGLRQAGLSSRYYNQLY